MRKTFIQAAVVCLVVFCIAVVLVPAAAAQSNQSKVIQSDAVVFGKTYGQWSATWWQWALSLHAPGGHPLVQTGSMDCSTGQGGPVWFLGGRFCANDDPNCGFTNIVRSCTMPANKALYIAVANAENSAPEVPNYQIADIMAGNSAAMDGVTNIFFQVDGAAVPHLKENFRVQSPAFGITMPDDNLFKAIYPPGSSFPGGTYFPAVDEGIYVMLSPLNPGSHVIRFGASFGPNFSFDVAYFLTVVK